MQEIVRVRTLKGFHNEGSYAKRNTNIPVTEQRARELEANGLVEHTGDEDSDKSGAKKAPAPGNKKAPPARNK